MLTYTRNEAIAEMTRTAYSVKYRRGYGLYVCGARLHGHKGEFVTNDEEWLTGILDGAKYNPSLKDEDFLGEIAAEAKANGTDIEDTLCAMGTDPANKDNYEPAEHIDARIAERVLDGWEKGGNTEGTPINIVFSSDGGKIFVLSKDEVRACDDDTRILGAFLDGDGVLAKKLINEWIDEYA